MPSHLRFVVLSINSCLLDNAVVVDALDVVLRFALFPSIAYHASRSRGKPKKLCCAKLFDAMGGKESDQESSLSSPNCRIQLISTQP